ncbi:MAG: patatin-like phospholipase family protein [Pseudomonadota bacterium]
MARTFDVHMDPVRGPKRILSLAGGGVRGLLTLGILARLEEIYQQRSGNPDGRLSDYYDLVAGTSTGSIIATGLALGWKVSDIKGLYDELCPILFKPNRRLGVFKPRFEAEPLIEKLQQHLGDQTLGSPELRTGLLVCAKRIDTDSAWLLNNHPGGKYYDVVEANQTWHPNKDFRLRDIVRASAAAPSFLEPVEIEVAPKTEVYDAEVGVFVDGAISGHNCPAFAALQIATLKPYGFNWNTGENNLSVLSLGTGQYREKHTRSEFLDKNTVGQAISALKGMINESQRNTILTMQALSESPKAWYLNSEIGGLEGVTLSDAPMFKFRHIDVEIERSDEMRDRLRVGDLSGKKMDKIIDGMRDMANGRKKNLDFCYRLGVSVGNELGEADFFFDTATPPAPAAEPVPEAPTA